MISFCLSIPVIYFFSNLCFTFTFSPFMPFQITSAVQLSKHVTDSHTTVFFRNDSLYLECLPFPFDLLNPYYKSHLEGTSLNPHGFQRQMQVLYSTVQCKVPHCGSYHHVFLLSFPLDYKEEPCMLTLPHPYLSTCLYISASQFHENLIRQIEEKCHPIL